jgi:hypothetical protein
MSGGRTAAGAAERVGSGAGRVLRAWRNLSHERRLAAGSAIGLFVTLFLPWYQETVIASGTTNLRSASATLTGWNAFSFVEAAVLLVAAGVLTLLFVRAEGRAFHVPGGDGGVITAAGFWTCVLIIWRIFDKQGTSDHNQFVTTWGIEWGIFVALLVGAVIAYAGNRIRTAHQPEPLLPGEEPLLTREPDTGARARRRAWTPRPVAADAPAGARADALPRARAEAPPQARPDAPPRARAEAPPQARPDAPAQPPGTPARPTRRRRPLTEAPQRGPEAAADQAAADQAAADRAAADRASGEPGPKAQPTRRRRPESGQSKPVADEDPPTRRLGSDEERTRPLSADPGDASEPSRAAKSGPGDRRKRPLPLDPVQADADWEVGEFRTRRLTDDDRRPRRPDDQLTIPLEQDDGLNR